MGQKVNPIGLRLGINRTWDSRWFADGNDYGRLLHEDIKVRKELKKRLGRQNTVATPHADTTAILAGAATVRYERIILDPHGMLGLHHLDRHVGQVL